MFSNRCLAEIRTISNNSYYTNTNLVYEAIKRTLERTVKLVRSQSIYKMLKTLRANRIGTEDVESLAARINEKFTKGKHGQLVNLVMELKVKDARREYEHERYANTKTWRESKRVIQEAGVMADYNRLWRSERSLFYRSFQEKMKTKLEHLKGKYKKTRTITDVVHGVRVSDAEIPDSFSSEPRCYGGCTLSNEEMTLLNLHPKFAVYEQIDDALCEIQIEKGVSKLRWSLMSQENSAESLEGDSLQPDQERQLPNSNVRFSIIDVDHEEVRNQQNEEIFDTARKCFDFRNMKATDLPFNKRITLPPALEDRRKELSLQNLKENLIRKSKQFSEVHKGDKYGNLSQKQLLGLKSLYGRIANSEVVVFQTDKSSRFSVDTPANYRIATAPHAENDMVISLKDHDTIETKLSAHTIMWMRMINAGESVNQQERVRISMVNRHSPIAPLYSLRKDHKTNFDIVEGPPSRPVCGATGSLNEKFSYLLSTILDKVWQDVQHETVCISTEELLSAIDVMNSEFEETGEERKVVVGSADVKALYPSLDIDFTVKIVSEMFEKSAITIDGVDYEEMGLYLAYNRSTQEMEEAGISECCPKRRYNRRPPEIQGAGIKSEKRDRFAPWVERAQQPDEWQKRRLITESLKVAMNYIMKNHVYLFGNEIKKQSQGGPIGLQLTGTLAQVFMVWWDKQFDEKMTKLNIEVPLRKRYVDDINMCAFQIEPGTRFENGQLMRGVPDEDELEEDARVFEILKSVGDSIHESIQLEVDYPSKHTDRKVPILDVKVFVEGNNRVMYEFYAKDVSSKRMLDARSAQPWAVKRTVLTQEVIRVLSCCSPNLPWGDKVKHVEEMVKRMQYSGYTRKFRFEVVDSAVKAYRKIEDAVQKKERPLHRPRAWNREERDRRKTDKKGGWYKKGGYDSVIFVAATPGSELKTVLQEEVNRSEFKIRVVETAGRSLKSSLQKSNPFRESRCLRQDCPICETDGKGRCDRNSVLYKITCMDCGDRYHGETSRSGYERCREHRRNLLEESDESCLWNHCLRKHAGERKEFQYDVVKSFKNDAMLRQISESVTINRVPLNQTMNEKSEWNQPRVPRAVIQ